ncbi:hypothetical protein BN903_230 [Halorubrum sp. AJ67]|nr:hypothetical protein BN903_230 [Halorubrum sp. AJ67]
MGRLTVSPRPPIRGLTGRYCSVLDLVYGGSVYISQMSAAIGRAVRIELHM